MESEKFNKYSNITLHYKFWMSNKDGEHAIGDGRLQLLMAIHELGSLRAAAEKLEISYRKAWGDLEVTEEILGFPLIEKKRGGKDGGTTTLTEDGRILISAYAEFRKEFQETINNSIIKFKKTLKNS
jgi:molybdate transport system regulatory protein